MTKQIKSIVVKTHYEFERIKYVICYTAYIYQLMSVTNIYIKCLFSPIIPTDL